MQRFDPRALAVSPDGSVYVVEPDSHRVSRVDPAGAVAVLVGTGLSGCTGDGGPARLAQLAKPGGLDIGPDGSVYVADAGNNRVRRIAPDGTVETVAGTGEPGFGGDGGPAVRALLDTPVDVAVGPDCAVYVADFWNHRIRRIASDGTIETVAGTGEASFGGDGGPAVAASLDQPAALALGPAGLYVADEAAHRIRRIGPDGSIITVAGTGESGTAGDGGPAVDAELAEPGSVVVDAHGRLLVTAAGHRVRCIDPDGTITTIAGGDERGSSGDGGPAVAARLDTPAGVAAGPDGAVYVADTGNARIRHIDPDGMIDLVTAGPRGCPGDGGPATGAPLRRPMGIAVGPDGAVYVADRGDSVLRRVDPDGTVDTFVGLGAWGFSDDGEPARLARLAGPCGVAVDVDATVYVADTSNFRIRRVGRDGALTTVLGIGRNGAGPAGDGTPFGTGGPQELNEPIGVALGPDSALYVADTFNHRVQRVDRDGSVRTVAGTGEPGSAGDGGPAIAAQLNRPRGVAVGAGGTVYVADTNNDRVRRVTADGTMSTVAGTGERGFAGDGGPAVRALLTDPASVAVGADGVLYLADLGNRRVRRVSADGVITTVAGNGQAGFSGDGGPAERAALSEPVAVALARDGALLVSDTENGCVRRIGADGRITTVVGVPAHGFSGDGGPATAARLHHPSGLALGPEGELYVADHDNGRLRRVDASGTITTVAGDGSTASSGDGGPAVSAGLPGPVAVAVAPDGGVFVGTDADRVRRIGRDGTISTAVGTGEPGFSGDGGPADRAELFGPIGIAACPDGSLSVADSGNNRIRRIDAAGLITTVAGTGEPGSVMAGGPATEADLAQPTGIAVGPDGACYVTEPLTHRLRRIAPDGTVDVVAGGIDVADVTGDGGPAVLATLDMPYGVAVGPDGSVYVADFAGGCVRRVAPDGTITTVAGNGGNGFSGDGGPAVLAELAGPQDVVVDRDGALFIADSANHRVRRVDPSGTITTVAGGGA